MEQIFDNEKIEMINYVTFVMGASLLPSYGLTFNGCIDIYYSVCRQLAENLVNSTDFETPETSRFEHIEKYISSNIGLVKDLLKEYEISYS